MAEALRDVMCRRWRAVVRVEARRGIPGGQHRDRRHKVLGWTSSNRNPKKIEEAAAAAVVGGLFWPRAGLPAQVAVWSIFFHKKKTNACM